MSSVYWTSSDRPGFQRYDANVDNATAFDNDVTGHITIQEYDTFQNAIPDVLNLLRTVSYDPLTDIDTITIETLRYSIGSPIMLGNLDNNAGFLGNANYNIYGESGNDTITVDTGNNIVHGGLGNDTIRNTNHTGTAIFFGNQGNDRLDGGRGNDYLFGGNDDDTIHGHGGNDVIVGGLDDDIIHGDAGHDVILDMYGDNTVYGGLDEEFSVTGSGNDYVASSKNPLLIGLDF